MIKNCNLPVLIPRPLQRTSKLQENPSALKRTSSNLKHEISLLFSFFVGHFCPPGSRSGFRIRIRTRIHWTNPIRIRIRNWKILTSRQDRKSCQSTVIVTLLKWLMEMHLTSFSFSMRTFFRATILFLSVLHLALKTSPKVPWPILAIFSYLLQKEHADTCETEIWYFIPVHKRKESTAAALSLKKTKI